MFAYPAMAILVAAGVGCSSSSSPSGEGPADAQGTSTNDGAGQMPSNMDGSSPTDATTNGDASTGDATTTDGATDAPTSVPPDAEADGATSDGAPPPACASYPLGCSRLLSAFSTTLEADVVSLIIDSTYAYWDTSDQQSIRTNSADHVVMRAPLAGGDAQTLASGLHAPAPLSVNSTWIYWSDNTDNKVYYTTKDGSDHAGSVAPHTAATGSAVNWTAATDATLYVTDLTNSRIAKEAVGASNAFSSLITNQPALAGLVNDATRLYWTNLLGTGGNGWGNVVQASLDGGSPVTLANPSKGLLGNPTMVTVGGTTVAWGSVPGITDAGGSVGYVPIGGGTVTIAPTESGVFPLGVAVDGTYVYWTDSNGGILARAPLAGGAAETLAIDATGPVVVDANNVYYFNGNKGLMALTK
jgi:hypothetical protein